jgi:Domain of unknown function (DUF4263)
VTKVFDEESSPDSSTGKPEWTKEVILTSPGGRKQIQLQVAREAGQVREIKIQKVPRDGDEVDDLLTLNRDASQRLIQMIRGLDYIPIEGGAPGVKVDDDLIRDVFSDPDAINAMYRSDPEQFRELIANDDSASDIVAVAHRRKVIEHFRGLLADDEFFEREKEKAGGPEKVWQKFLEDNPWILGITLAGQLLTAWDETRLEQVVAGFSVAEGGKRTDALLRTNGAIRSLCFAEIKHHKTPLLGDEYRRGVWGTSSDLAGGIAQMQQTVFRARQQLADRLRDKDEDGAETGEVTFLVRPRSYLIIGNLNELRGDRGVHVEKHRSFELNRRNLYEPEIVTFDELLARAEWHVSVAEPSD